MKFVIVAYTDDRGVMVYGTKTGRPFSSERAAGQAARRIEENYPGGSVRLRTVVAELQEEPIPLEVAA